MRLSTAGFHRSTINAILEHQTKLANTQTQITTGKKFQSASEDPIGAVRASGLDRKLADNAQYERNSNIIKSRLSYAEQTLGDITSVLQSARDSALAGANATLGQSERKMIANQVRQNLAALMDMANRQDGNGEYLFAGTSTATRPFSQGAAGVN
jgi:flagellar hook-associated protein 3 FlgL